MKFALVDQQRQEAQPGLLGACPVCAHPMVAKCGALRIWHWAHQSNRLCDHWWENETEWHRTWKGYFPTEWQEVVHMADSGEKHIADVKTAKGWVLEFQNSFIKLEERKARENFYQRVVWVVNGARRKRDSQQFLNAWNDGERVGSNSSVRRVFAHECLLIKEWATSRVPVVLDFGEDVLWWVLPPNSNGIIHVVRFQRSEFINIHRTETVDNTAHFDRVVAEANKLYSAYELQLRPRPVPLQGFERYLARRARSRPRL